MNRTIKLGLFAMASLLLAQPVTAQFPETDPWPQTPGVGKVFLADTTRNLEVTGVEEAPDGSLRILVRAIGDGYYDEDVYELHAMSRDGSFLWPVNRENCAFGKSMYYDSRLLPHKMICGPDGRTWIVFEDEITSGVSAPESFGYTYTTGELFAQIIENDGTPANEYPINLANGYSNLMNQLMGVAWGDDTGTLVFYMRYEILSGWPPVETMENRQLRVDRLLSDGTRLWPQSKLLCDTLPAWVGGVMSDDHGGAVVMVGNTPWHVSANGEIAIQAPVSILGKQFRGYSTLEVEPNRMLLLAYDKEETTFYFALIDSEGSVIHSSSVLADIYMTYYLSDLFPINNEGFGFTYHTRDHGDHLIQIDSELNLVSQTSLDENIGKVWYADHGWFGRVAGVTTDISTSSNPLRSWVTRQDLTGETVWTDTLTEASLYDSHPYPFVASDGTTYVFWSQPGMGANRTFPNQRDIYVNVIDLDGNWGVQETTGVGESYAGLPGGFSVGVYPNPTNAAWNVTVETPSRAAVRLELYNLVGRKVMESLAQPAAGRTTVHFDGRGLASGVYLVRVDDGAGHFVTKRITLLK